MKKVKGCFYRGKFCNYCYIPADERIEFPRTGRVPSREEREVYPSFCCCPADQFDFYEKVPTNLTEDTGVDFWIELPPEYDSDLTDEWTRKYKATEIFIENLESILSSLNLFAHVQQSSP
jgi:radical SAM superfamily enzyme YgiQ (UPF0313 family)